LIDAQRVDFIAVPTKDRAKAAEFYERTLGLQKNPNSSESWIEFETGNVTLALVVPEEAGQDFAPLPFGTIALRVPDIEVARTALESQGIEVGNTWDSGVCNGASFRDPDGNGIVIHHRYAPYPDGTTP
jgi:catechol 2,3-dioxygenase-like lactoylglutathione lyase family enzyme